MNIKALMRSEQAYKYRCPDKIEFGEVIFVPRDQIENVKQFLIDKNLELVPDNDVRIYGWYYVRRIII